MYVHIGGEYTLSDRTIVGIFDFDMTTVENSETIEFLQQAETAGRLEMVSPDIPRAFVVTPERVFVTPISATTLRRRLSRQGRDLQAAWLEPDTVNE